MLINANLTEHSPQGFTKYFKGPFYDYLPGWYGHVGEKIVTTMIINSILPFLNLFKAFIVPYLKGKWDRRWGNDHYSSKNTSLPAYRDVYSGPKHEIHSKYANILKVMYITMMYGLGMPILFLVAVFTFINQYVCERIGIAYFYQQPPAYDDILSKNALQMIKKSAIFFLFNGYWMLTNPQIFENKFSFISLSTDSMKSQHIAF